MIHMHIYTFALWLFLAFLAGVFVTLCMVLDYTNRATQALEEARKRR